jgi:antitoxin FitA
LVRDVPPETMNELKARAQRNNRSLEAELRVILQQVASEPQPIDRLAAVERVRALFEGRTFDDSAELIREDRER